MNRWAWLWTGDVVGAVDESNVDQVWHESPLLHRLIHLGPRNCLSPSLLPPSSRAITWV